MSKVYISTNDPVIYRIYSEDETVNIFGEDFLPDYGTEIPDELLKRYQANYAEFWSIQEEIEKIKESK